MWEFKKTHFSLLIALFLATGIWSRPYFLQDWFLPETINLGVIYGSNRLPQKEQALLNRHCSQISYTSGQDFILTFLNEEGKAGIPPWFVSRGMDFTADKATWVSALKDTGAFTVYESWVARKGSFEGSSVPIALICPVVYGVWTEDSTIQIYATFTPDGKEVYSFSVEWNNEEIVNDPAERYEATKATSIWAKLPLELQQHGDFLFLCGLAYVQSMGASADDETNRVYAQTAFSYFSKADGAGLELPENIQNWMWQVREGL